MRKRLVVAAVVLIAALSFSIQMQSQERASSSAATLPRLIRFSGSVTDDGGSPLTGVVGITFALYSEQSGGAPLWLETQNVQADLTGRYTVLLGASKPDGLPTDLFTSGEARWVGVQVAGQPERTRTLLVSAPYALKAGDAETVGGLPASAFALAKPVSSNQAIATGSASPPKAQVQPQNPALTGKGTVGYVPMWDTTTDLVDSTIFQKSSNIGIGTKTPAATLDVSGKGDIRDTLTLFPKGSDSTLAVNGTAFKVDHAGKVTFISGQAFPGVGTVTSVGSGTGLTGGPITKTGTLSIASAGVTNAMLQHSSLKLNPGGGMTGGGSVALGGAITLGLKNCAASQVLEFIGGAWSCSNTGTGTITAVIAGTDLTGGGTGGTVTLNLDTTRVPQLAANNTFTGAEQVFNNSVIVGPITTFTQGELAAGSPSVNNPAFGAVGFTTTGGSGGNGGSGIVSRGGSGDFQSNNGNTGGAAISAEGGGGSTGGAGISAFGGGAIEGGCCADGPGGFFAGGSNNLQGDGIEAMSGGGWAGDFLGSINVTGTLFASVKDFKIDHPLDPSNKYLVHASVESSEMMNIYSGNVTTDDQGEAIVHLPNWFEALNTDFRYQLTVIGQFAQAIVAREIQNKEFAIRTSTANVKVSWQVTAVRQDAFAKANPLIVEQQKETRLRGFYIHPELYGAPTEKQIEWARHPELMRRTRERKTSSHSPVKAVPPIKSVPSKSPA